MYKKYITKKGKKIGPYFYESIRQPIGTVREVYLGRNEQVTLQRLQALKGQKLELFKETVSAQQQPAQQIHQQPPLPKKFKYCTVKAST